MMSQSVSQCLRVLAVLVLGGLLVACSQHAAKSANDPGQKVCSASENLAVCFFASTNFQSDGKAERREVVQALRDALELPLEELRARRYADAMGEPNKWTFEELLSAYFSGKPRMSDGDGFSPTTDGFLEAIKQPESIPTLERALADMEDSIQYGTGN